MKFKSDFIVKTVMITGTLLVLSIFSLLTNVINISIDSFTGTSCVISAFAG